MNEVVLVVPTIRENCLYDFLERWKGINKIADIMIMEDNPRKTFILDEVNYHYSWEDIRADGLDELIPRRSDCVRSYAYFKAWSHEYKYIMTLDDDCYPRGFNPDEPAGSDMLPVEFVEHHIKMLEGRSKWFNTLNNVKPRGIPYYNLGQRNDIVVNHGLWTNVVDYDAPTQLVNPIPEEFSFDNKIVPSGSFFPMCGMNLMWKADYTPLMYHLLMGNKLDTSSGELTKYPFDRFGDIWAGIFMKKCLDILGKSVSTGTPYIRHERASNPFTNLKKEANGLEVNEKLWEYVDSFISTATYTHAGGFDDTIKKTSWIYEELGTHITRFDQYPEYKSYFIKLGHSMSSWAKLFTLKK